MGEYRFSVYFRAFIGLTIGIEKGQIVVRIPFVAAHISVNRLAVMQGYD